MSTNLNPTDWISLAEAARIRGVSRQAISKLVRIGRISSTRIAGHVFARREDVINYQHNKPGRPKMVDDSEEIFRKIEELSEAQKRLVFENIRKSLNLHPLEEMLGVQAEAILEAILRSSDLTIRGIKGLIAESVFVTQVIPSLIGWKNEAVIDNPPYDALLCKGEFEVRVQVKMQRTERGAPKRSEGRTGYVVEVQKTRTGKKAGVDTRPYRFDDFDLLAVCMRASTGNWASFMYAAAKHLVPKARDPECIHTMQSLPPHPEDARLRQDSMFEIESKGWTHDINVALEGIYKLRDQKA